MNVVFMGTPDFAVGTLEALIAAGHSIRLVVTQPDKARGRGNKVSYSPVKEAALKHGLPVFQPKRIRDPEAVDRLRDCTADVIVVVAFGQILPQEILDLPKYGCVNVHASLLPKYRGAAPIQWSVIHGDAYTGVTTMQMDAGMDTGDMLLKEQIRLDPQETGGSLFDRLSGVGAALCVKTLAGLAEGSITPTPQDESQATYTRMIQKSDGRIDFTEPARRIECLIRGMNPWPSAFTRLHGRTLKIWSAQVTDPDALPNGRSPGEVLALEKDGFTVMTGQGILKVTEVQAEGKKRMDAGAFLRGYSLQAGEKLGADES